MLASLDTEIGGFNCLATTEGHVREKFILEAQGSRGCENSLEDKKSGTKLDTWTEKEFMESNFESVLGIYSYESSLIDDVDIYARTILNTNGAKNCAEINSQELEDMAIQLDQYITST